MPTTTVTDPPPAATVEQHRLHVNSAGLWSYGIWIVLALLVAVLLAVSPSFRTTTNLTNILEQNAMIGIVALGMLVMMVSGGFDLSVGATGATSAVVGAYLSMHGGLGVAIPGALAVGLVVGPRERYRHRPLPDQRLRDYVRDGERGHRHHVRRNGCVADQRQRRMADDARARQGRWRARRRHRVCGGRARHVVPPCSDEVGGTTSTRWEATARRASSRVCPSSRPSCSPSSSAGCSPPSPADPARPERHRPAVLRDGLATHGDRHLRHRRRSRSPAARGSSTARSQPRSCSVSSPTGLNPDERLAVRAAGGDGWRDPARHGPRALQP